MRKRNNLVAPAPSYCAGRCPMLTASGRRAPELLCGALPDAIAYRRIRSFPSKSQSALSWTSWTSRSLRPEASLATRCPPTIYIYIHDIHLSIYVCVHLSIHLSVYLPIHLCIHLSVHLTTQFAGGRSTWPSRPLWTGRSASIHLSILSLFIPLSIYLPVCPSIHPPIYCVPPSSAASICPMYVCVYLSIHLCVYPSIRPSISPCTCDPVR
jgi:hypothetical protein